MEYRDMKKFRRLTLKQNYDWYESVSANLPVTQGDILRQVPVPFTQAHSVGPNFMMSGIYLIDAIVVSQACDLENEKVDNVILCPIDTLKDMHRLILASENKNNSSFDFEKTSKGSKESVINKLNAGHYLQFYVLNKDTKYPGGGLNEYHIVNLKELYTLPLGVLNHWLAHQSGLRLRLLPPYREQLSQAFSMTFMRIGQPQGFRIEYGDIQ